MKMASVETQTGLASWRPSLSTKLEKGGILRLLSAKVRQFSGVETKKKEGEKSPKL